MVYIAVRIQSKRGGIRHGILQGRKLHLVNGGSPKFHVEVSKETGSQIVIMKFRFSIKMRCKLLNLGFGLWNVGASGYCKGRLRISSSRRYITTAGVYLTTVSGYRHFMVVFSLIRCNNTFNIVRGPFHMLPHRTSSTRAFVVAPAGET